MSTYGQYLVEPYWRDVAIVLLAIAGTGLALALLPLSELAGERVTPDSSPAARRGPDRTLLQEPDRVHEISMSSRGAANPARAVAPLVSLSASTSSRSPQAVDADPLASAHAPGEPQRVGVLRP